MAWRKARASAPSSEKSFFTTKEALISLRWYTFLLAMKRFIFGRRVSTFSTAVTMIWNRLYLYSGSPAFLRSR